VNGNDLLYHYTTQEGLLGIIESGMLWATHVQFLNDEMEFKLGLRRFEECLLAPEVQGLIEQMLRLTFAHSSQTSESYLPERERYNTLLLHPLKTLPTYCVSFTAQAASSDSTRADAGDDLSQWRGYSGGSGGFAIGFDRKALEAEVYSLPDTKDVGHVFGNCIYRAEHQRQPLTEKIMKLIELDQLYAVNGGNSNGETVDQKMAVVKELIPLIPLIKDESFRSENEVRIVRFQQGEEGVKFRRGSSSLVPYVEIPVANAPRQFSPLKMPPISTIRWVVVGPSARMEDAKKSLEMLLRRHGYTDVSIDSSTIPYRDW